MGLDRLRSLNRYFVSTRDLSRDQRENDLFKGMKNIDDPLSQTFKSINNRGLTQTSEIEARVYFQWRLPCIQCDATTIITLRFPYRFRKTPALRFRSSLLVGAGLGIDVNDVSSVRDICLS